VSGRVVQVLIRKQVEAYRAQGLPEEALDLVGATLRANPDLPDHVRSGLEEQMRQLQSELASRPPDEQAVVSDEQIDIVRRGWAGSDTLDDHRECAECLHALGRWAEALGEYRAAVQKGLPPNRILSQLADCLSRAYPPPAVPEETARFATGMLRDPDGIFHFELIMAERMAAAGQRDHAAALTRRLIACDRVPERHRARLSTLAERLLVQPAAAKRSPMFKRLRDRLRRRP
jgi:hypothetical protein